MEHKEGLNKIFTNLIAKKNGVKPEEVTVEYIGQQREKIHPNTRFKPPYNNLISFTKNELKGVGRYIDSVMDVFRI